jgi:Ca2+-binding RTX toxin-like protein
MGNRRGWRIVQGAGGAVALLAGLLVPGFSGAAVAPRLTCTMTAAPSAAYTTVTLTDNADVYDGSAASGPLFILAGGGDDKIVGSAFGDIILGGAGNDQIYGGGGDDFICGNDGNDQIAGGDGNDVLAGNAGDDRLDGGAGNDQISGDAGDDLLDGGAGTNTNTDSVGTNVCFNPSPCA